ncbi:hypothetical protein JYU34_002199 [Plutella xylostella]|uniref:Uncharacterized protein n=1 Tax=Plutella xylostella TaxID=51655 RepID=A0ABQ7R1L0_PLUXY|nr:hypothetical protein JYU34_002199 [Plutella xylostella]
MASTGIKLGETFLIKVASMTAHQHLPNMAARRKYYYFIKIVVTAAVWAADHRDKNAPDRTYKAVQAAPRD